MTEQLRSLTPDGAAVVRKWLAQTRVGIFGDPPTYLLRSEEGSQPVEVQVVLEQQPFGRPFMDRYELGRYLCEQLRDFPKTALSRNSGIWNWLALFYMDQLAPVDASGRRYVYQDEAYVLEEGFSFRKYYRHAIRTPWLVVHEHGESSRVLLIPAGKSDARTGVLVHRGEIIEQLAARQWLIGSSAVIGAVHRLYMDMATMKPKRGTGGSGRGSPRRLAAVLQQLELTYDLRECSIDRFLSLLPPEFDRWK